ncbi:MAG: DNA polymerase II [Candidatus Hydrogenedentes bacterium]|nr:DNA polymerase II [Candidatus Hydrogenedentota bacterium]
MHDLPAFLLTRNQRSTREGYALTYWFATPEGPVQATVTGERGVFFIPRATTLEGAERKEVALITPAGEPVDAVYYRTWQEAQDTRARAGTARYESDVRPVDRYLMERFVYGSAQLRAALSQASGFLQARNPELRPGEHVPALKVLSIDIETQGLDGELYSIACVGRDTEVVFMRGAGAPGGAIRWCDSEQSVIAGFLAWIAEEDPDVLLGWNVVSFDLNYLINRSKLLGLPFRLGRAQGEAIFRPARQSRQLDQIYVPGRVVLDGIATLQTMTYQFEQYSLEAVARELLGKGKLIHEADQVEAIDTLFREDPATLAAYNLEDCRLVLEIFDRTSAIEFMIERSRLTGLAMDRHGGSVAAFDFLYLPHLHRAGYVAPDLPEDPNVNPSPGGYVMDSQPGLYHNVAVLDFKSLYPSIIRTFNIDPLAMYRGGDDAIPGFFGGAFSRDQAILPGIIARLWAARDVAKAHGQKSHSTAIKIIMNAFYGVLGTPGCRFYDPRLAGSITRYGHQLLTRSKDFVEAAGCTVIYGDTDSVFVLLGADYAEPAALEKAAELAAALNAWWRETLRVEFDVESHLEIEFETLYLRFLMPTIRNSEEGTKKRYAGLLRNSQGKLEVAFKGLESVRTDWTPLARSFQRELFRRVFLDEPVEDYIRQIARAVVRGELDDALIYRKRLRKAPEAYTKNVPPHVQAARKLKKPGTFISYWVTTAGPEPASQREHPIDYQHYLERQLAPAADSILQVLGLRFADLTGDQLWLFPPGAT